jgi:Flp pilus assembly protein TadB
VGVAAGLVAAWHTNWPVLAVLVPAAVVWLPHLLTPPPLGTPIERLEAMEEWTRSLAGVLTVGVGLEQAIMATVASAPTPIRGEVTALAARLHARTPTTEALHRLAGDLADPTGDLIVLQLQLAAARRGSGLAAVLEGLATSVGREVSIRRAVTAERAKLVTTSRWVTLITIAVMGALLLSNYSQPYRTPLGALVLTVLLGAYLAALAWMRQLGATRTPPRLITDTPTPTAAPTAAATGAGVGVVA